MLEGLEAVELRFSEVLEDNESFRIDSEYFKKEYLEIEKNIKLKGFNYFKDYINILTDYTSNGSFASLKSNVVLYDYKKYAKWIRINELDKMDFINCRYTDKRGYNFLAKTKLFGGELLISKTGEYLGKAFIVPKLDEKATLADNIFLIRLKNISKELIQIYINSKIGQQYIKRFSQGVGQPTIIKDSLRSIKIPIFSQTFQQQIENIVKSAYEKLKLSKELYKEAEDVLLAELDLKDFKPSKDNISIKSFKESFFKTGRLDSEYYQPKYEQIENKIKSYKGGWDYVGNIVDWKKGVEVGSEAYQEEGKDFIRISDFSKDGIEPSSKKISNELYEELKDEFKPNIGDILFTKDGTIGITYVVKDDIKGILSGAFLRLTLKEQYKNYKKETLALIFNSIITKLQIEKLSGGAIIAHLKPIDFETFMVPILEETIQTQIEEKIKESFKLKKESKELLELAKKAVEIAIESGEDEAIKIIQGIRNA